ncbi:hypothetical protein [Thermogemmata fonticola]|uniref:Bulb-type lectin domain-containing protein n=1 Tax=Thermogemmata fonticola TaxID=2755323 RepID=A0A7V8VDX9_9BACT|nr:hypothetical protein [Thermogemmata fonticola]MBA2226265.1 hypothetical protein [Thermogemmata fonticola]
MNRTSSLSVVLGSSLACVFLLPSLTWAQETKDTLQQGESLQPGQKLVSQNGQFELVMQNDGNLVLYKVWEGAREAVWDSGSCGHPGSYCILQQDDGHFVIYNKAGKDIWANWRFGGRKLVVQNDGNVVIYNSKGEARWATMTLFPDYNRYKKALAGIAPLVKPNDYWTTEDFNTFLDSLPKLSLLSLKQSLGLIDENKKPNLTYNANSYKIKEELLNASNNILIRWFKDPNNIDYHEIVQWVAGKLEIDKEKIANYSTFMLEREILEQMFVKIWDGLSKEQREELLNQLDPNGKIQDKAGIAALSGAAALAALSATVYFTGFAFYTTMSVVIYTVAGFFGLTIPFAGYIGASSLVALLSGPVGWVLIAVGAIVGIGLLGRADWKKCAAFVIQMHLLKVQALQAAGVSEKEIFGGK